MMRREKREREKREIGGETRGEREEREEMRGEKEAERERENSHVHQRFTDGKT